MRKIIQTTYRSICLNVVAFLFLGVSVSAQTTAFNFQGRLNDGSTPANGTYELQFKLFDTIAGGGQIGGAIDKPAVLVINGIFSTQLDFGAAGFDGAARFVEIGVRVAGSPDPFTILNPRQQVLSTPYSIQAKNAAQLGGVDASEYVTTSTVGNSFIKNATVQQTANLNISGSGFFAGNVGIGTAAPTSKLQVVSSGHGITQTSGAVTVGSFISTASGGSGWFGTRSNHPLNFFTNDSLPQLTLSTVGNLGIGTTTPTAKLEVQSAIAGLTGVYAESPSGRAIWGKSVGSRGVYGESSTLEGVYGISGSGAGVAGRSTSNSGVYGESSAVSLTAGGVYGIGTGSGSIGVIGQSNLGTAVGVFGTSTSSTGFGIYARNTSSGGRAIFAEGNVDVVGITKTNILQITGGSDLAEKFDVAIDVAKDGKISGNDAPRPGVVMAIDRLGSGKLVVSRTAYNRRVAGVISGANNLAAGLLLPNLSDAKNAHAIALSGRVWVYADATRNPIAPGDLLTTSATPGHAMKVTDHTKAQGAIIGKAMNGLKGGRGLILVLVSLQ